MRNWIINLFLVIMLAGCSSIPTNTPIVDTTSPISPATDAINTATPVRTATLPATATTRPTETEPYYKFEVTAEKLNHRPADYEYLRTHLNEFVQSPSPWDLAAFYQWIDENLDPVLGEVALREPNVVFEATISGDFLQLALDGDVAVPPIGEIPFFYFIQNGTPYPVYIVNGQKVGQEGTSRSIGVILVDGFADGFDSMRDIYDDNLRFAGAGIAAGTTGGTTIPDDIGLFIEATGFGGGINDMPRRTRIGFGGISFFDNP